MNIKNMGERYEKIRTRIPENGLNIEGLKNLTKAIFITDGIYRDVTIISHLHNMESLGYIKADGMKWFACEKKIMKE